MLDAPPPPPPVPGMPTPLLASGEAVARAWLAGLVAHTPVDRAGELPLAALAREGPTLCAALLRALGSDDELALLPLLAANTGALAGAAEPVGTAAVVARLREATLDTALADAERPGPEWVGRLAARLGHACDAILMAALGELGKDGGGGTGRAAPGAPAADRLDAAAEPFGPVPDEAYEPIPDEAYEDLPDAAARPFGDPGPPLPDPLAALDRKRAPGRDGAPPWERMVARAVGRHLEDGQPFAVLAVEADGADRIVAAGGVGALERADRALHETVRARDRVVADPPARWWVVVPDAGADAARALARRIVAAVGGVEHAGAPLTASVGIASCPRDAATADGLLSAADERLLGARAGGDALGDEPRG